MLIVMGRSMGEPWEEIDTAWTREEARYLVQEYRIAFGSGWMFKLKKVPGDHLAHLKKEALESTTFRGHVMGEWIDYSGRVGAKCACLQCKAEVQVLTKPSPNEIDIGGEAVAVECRSIVQVVK